MSKAHRGSGIRDKVKSGRSTCPVCKRVGVKTIHSHEHDGKTLEICKICKASLSNGKKQEELNAALKA